MKPKRIVGLLMILAGVVIGWFGVPNGSSDKPLLTLAVH